MKKKVANHSLVILVLIISFGLFQARKESKRPFAFESDSNNKIRTSNPDSNKLVLHETKEFLY